MHKLIILLFLVSCMTTKKVANIEEITAKPADTTIISGVDGSFQTIDASIDINTGLGTILQFDTDIPKYQMMWGKMNDETNLLFRIEIEGYSGTFNLDSLPDDTYSITTTKKDRTILTINEKYFGRSYDTKSNTWSYVIPPEQESEICEYCLRFTIDGEELLMKPDGQVIINGELNHTSINEYFDALFILISLEQQLK